MSSWSTTRAMTGPPISWGPNYPFVTLIRNHENSGFGRGCNLGLGYAKAPYALLLNPDAVIDCKSIETLVEYMERNPRAGICGPAVRWASGELQASGDLPNPLTVVAAPPIPPDGQCATDGRSFLGAHPYQRAGYAARSCCCEGA